MSWRRTARWRSPSPPGWMRSEMMLENFGVTEPRWRDALDPSRAARGEAVASPAFALSESPRYVGRAVAALATDPERNRWNQRSIDCGRLATEYGFTDVDGSRPRIWSYLEDQDRDIAGDLDDYR